jgi:AcrR family transcriptional regulator
MCLTTLGVKRFLHFFEEFGGFMALTQEIIIHVALELLNWDGIENLTMRTLAAFLDTKAASLYRHLKDKGDYTI